jgi:precorrin-6B methylase 1
VQRVLVSIVLVSICFTLIYLIKNEVSIISKIQSLIVLATDLKLPIKDTSIFDAMDRLHAFKDTSHKITDLLAVADKLK